MTESQKARREARKMEKANAGYVAQIAPRVPDSSWSSMDGNVKTRGSLTPAVPLWVVWHDGTKICRKELVDTTPARDLPQYNPSVIPHYTHGKAATSRNAETWLTVGTRGKKGVK